MPRRRRPDDARRGRPRARAVDGGRSSSGRTARCLVSADAPGAAGRPPGHPAAPGRRPGRCRRRVLRRVHRRPAGGAALERALDYANACGAAAAASLGDQTGLPDRDELAAPAGRGRRRARHPPMSVPFEPDELVDALIAAEPRTAVAARRDPRRPGAGSGQPDRRAHRLQRGVRPAGGDRPGDPDRLPADRRIGASSCSGSTAASATASISTRPAPKTGSWLDYVAGTAWALDRGRPAPDRAARRRRLHAADERRPLVVGRDRARLGLGDAPRRGGGGRPVRARPALPARRERLRRRDGRPDGPVRRVVRRRRVGAVPRLPIDRAGARSRCRPTSHSSCCTPARRGRSRVPSTTSGAASARRPSPHWPGRIRRSAAFATSRRTRWPPRPAGSTPVEFRRARHIVSENDRVGATVAALEAGDLDAVGRLFAESHASLRDDYEVSSPELDAMVDIAVVGAGRDRRADDRCRVRWLHGEPGPTRTRWTR